MEKTETATLVGGCDCGAIRYKLESIPMNVQCCHCYRCQKRTGSAFVINALIESDQVSLLSGTPETVTSHTKNLNHQYLSQCSSCRVTLWSTFDAEGGFTKFVRVGTLDRPADFPPVVHIFTSSKQPWVAIPDGVPSFPEHYEFAEVWPAEQFARYQALEPQRSAHWDKWVIEARQKRKLAMDSAKAGDAGKNQDQKS